MVIKLSSAEETTLGWICARSGNRERFDVLSGTYGPMGRVLPR